MKKLPEIGRYFFAIGILGIGIEHFIYQDFMMGRAPAWPESLPGKQLWAYLTGTAFVIISMAILTGKRVRVAMLIAAILIFFWAFVRHIPIIAGDQFLSGAWTAAGKALVFLGGALAVAATFPKTPSPGNTFIAKWMNLGPEFIITARICLGIFLVIAGIQHFMYAAFVATLIPGWFPGDAVFWTYFAGVTLLAGGLGLFIPKTAPLAALLSGVMIFCWLWIVHVPRIMVSVSDNIAVFEALAFSGIAFVVMKFPAGE
jgi:uncharacterized membrane protein